MATVPGPIVPTPIKRITERFPSKRAAIARAKLLTKQTGAQHYVIASSVGNDAAAWYVENEDPFLRSSESLIFPAR